MIRFLRPFSVLAVLVLFSATLRAQPPGYFAEMPSADRVVQDMQVASQRESAVRAAVALRQLASMVQVLSGIREGRKPSIAEAAKVVEYLGRGQAAFGVEETKAGPPCAAGDDNCQYYLLNRCESSYTFRQRSIGRSWIAISRPVAGAIRPAVRERLGRLVAPGDHVASRHESDAGERRSEKLRRSPWTVAGGQPVRVRRRVLRASRLAAARRRKARRVAPVDRPDQRQHRMLRDQRSEQLRRLSSAATITTRCRSSAAIAHTRAGHHRRVRPPTTLPLRRRESRRAGLPVRAREAVFPPLLPADPGK